MPPPLFTRTHLFSYAKSVPRQICRRRFSCAGTANPIMSARWGSRETFLNNLDNTSAACLGEGISRTTLPCVISAQSNPSYGLSAIGRFPGTRISWTRISCIKTMMVCLFFFPNPVHLSFEAPRGLCDTQRIWGANRRQGLVYSQLHVSRSRAHIYNTSYILHT